MSFIEQLKKYDITSFCLSLLSDKLEAIMDRKVYQKMKRKRKQINVDIGLRIRQYREAQKLSREALAERVGITPRFCADLERGTVGASLSTLKKICEVLGISADSLFWDNGVRKQSIPDQLANLLSYSKEEYLPVLLRSLQNQLELIDLAEKTALSKNVQPHNDSPA